MYTLYQIIAEFLSSATTVLSSKDLSADAVLKLYTETGPLIQSLLICCLIFMPYSFLESVRRANYSIVDRLCTPLSVPLSSLGSVTPMIYPLVYMAKSQSLRLCVMHGLVLLWGLRLSFNLYRKGGYKAAHEDYRITSLFKQFKDLPVPRFISWILFQVFNLGFIVIFQHLLLWSITILPIHWVYTVESHSKTTIGWNILDTFFTVMFLVFLIIETVADDQMFAFQTEKHSKSKKKMLMTGDYALGFLTHGLFKYSRHPNFMAEQAMWLTLACFSISVQDPISYYYNTGSIVVRHLPYAFYGAFILVFLFQGSTDMTEKISMEKYPLYAEYMKKTSRFILLWSGGVVEDHKKKQ